MTVTANRDKLLDRTYEGKDLHELVDAPVSALAGVSDGDAKALKDAFNIKPSAIWAATSTSAPPPPWST